jgi:hypothetical protein
MVKAMMNDRSFLSVDEGGKELEVAVALTGECFA